MVNNQKISHRSSDSTEEIGRRGSSAGHCRGGDCERHQREGQRGLEVGQTTQAGGGGGALSSVGEERRRRKGGSGAAPASGLSMLITIYNICSDVTPPRGCMLYLVYYYT